jgi:hypothetical protein
MSTLLSVLCVESLPSFLIVHLQSVGLLCPGAPASVFSAPCLNLLCTVDCGLLWVSVKGAKSSFSSLTADEYPNFYLSPFFSIGNPERFYRVLALSHSKSVS